MCLDFDGVTHPEPCADVDYFCHLGRLETVLRAHVRTGVLITSNWRHDHTREQILDRLTPALAAMVVGFTPDHRTVRAPRSALLPYSRQLEIEAWRTQYGARGEAWCALDDWAGGFAPGCPQLILCDPATGLTDAVLRQLAARLQAARSEPVVRSRLP